MTEVELKKLAKQVIKTNLAVWKAIDAVEEFYGDKIYLMSEEDLKRLAKTMITLKNGTEQMADPHSNELYFEEFEWFGERLQEYIDKFQD